MIHIFHHVDLDGMGVKILSEFYATTNQISFQSHSCGYRRINDAVQNCLNTVFPEEIIIGDISVNEDVARKLDKAVQAGIKVRLRDHHETAKDLNSYDWALVESKDRNNIPRCGTYWLFQDPEFNEYRPYFQVLVDAIDDWDTWKWKENNNTDAKDLNALLSILGDSEFCEYITNIIYTSIASQTPITQSSQLFTERTKIMLDTHNRLIENSVRACERSLYTTNLWVYANKAIKLKTGIVFLNSDISEISDILLERHTELDVLMVVTLPGSISWRSRKPLEVSLSKIAKKATGMGGGHSQSASSNIAIAKFQDLMAYFMEKNFDRSLDYSNITPEFVRLEKRV